MAMYERRQKAVEATRWFSNGDHPEDECQRIDPRASLTASGDHDMVHREMAEGKVVGYYTPPGMKKNRVCRDCCYEMGMHGWIMRLDGRDGTVCPGDWIITREPGNYYPLKPDLFDEAFRPLYLPATTLDAVREIILDERKIMENAKGTIAALELVTQAIIAEGVFKATCAGYLDKQKKTGSECKTEMGAPT